MNPECVNCWMLGKCDEVDVPKLLAHHRCDRWEAAENPEEISARVTTIQMFGEAAVQALIKTTQEEG